MSLPTPPLPPEIWDTVPPVAQALILAHIAKLDARIAETVRVSPIAYVDETGFSEAGQRRWLWVAVTDTGTLFRLHKHRSQDARRELLGSHARGAKRVSDRAKAYEDIPLADRGICHAHLKRDFEALKGRSEATTEIATGFQREQRRLFTLHRQIRDGTVDRRERRNKTRMVKARFGALLRRGLDLPDAKLHTLCRDLSRSPCGRSDQQPG